MFEHLRNIVRGEVQRILRALAEPRQARVISYDPKRYAAKVGFLPEFDDPDLTVAQQAVSGWLPVSTSWSGPGWGLFSPPSPGDQVDVIFQEDDPQSGIIVGRVFDLLHPPLAVNSGEWWLVHKSGTFIKLTNDTNMVINVVGDWDITVGGTVNMTVQGTINVTSETEVVVISPLVKVNP